ncbi:box C/D snoRNA protein 1 [Copidosoma floridanum]|uniref:box C/D snoRNA protein 1 n=1 Tax=Copidosoma floridanum TaxID=29053 RepID=UPI0006C971E2|nr:box C/D snoRNA protein 1 [Copidosoma floridanum]
MESSIEKLDTCEVCAAVKAKYTCPKCEVRTCGLACVNIHKEQLECDGIRDKIKFVPVHSFTDLDLLSDYRLLEDLGRSVEKLQRNPQKNFTRENKALPVFLIKLKKAAYNRGINLQFMPQNFSRHKENTTFYKWKTNLLSWKIEFIFPQAGNIKWIVKKALETTRLSELLEDIFYSDFNKKSDDDESMKLSVLQDKLKFYRSCGVSGLKVLLKAEKVEKSDSRFYELDLTQSIQENLKNKTIIEYPIIYVVLKDHTDMFEIIDSDEEVERTDESQKERKNIKQNIRNHTVKNNEADKEKIDASLKCFFSADISDSEDDDDNVISSYDEKKNFESYDSGEVAMS